MGFDAETTGKRVWRPNCLFPRRFQQTQTAMRHLLFLSALFALAIAPACRRTPQQKETAFLKKGNDLLQKKDYSHALLEFQNAAAQMPKDAEPYYRLGLTYVGQHNVVAAYQAFRHATDLNPKHKGAQIKLAEILTATRRKDVLEDAAKRLRGVLADSPGAVEASDTLAVAEAEMGDTASATRRLNEIAEKAPADLHAAVNLARLKLQQHDFKGAEEAIRKVEAAAPKQPQPPTALAQLFLAANQLDKAEDEVRRALGFDPNNGPALATLADILARGKRMDELDQVYKRLSTLPDKRYRNLHARFLYQTGKRDAALTEFEQLTKSNPDDRATRSELVAIYFQMGKVAQAQQALASALKKNARDTDALFQRSQLYLQSGKIDEAMQDLTQVLHFQPDSAKAHVAIGIAYDAKGEPANKQREFTEALKLNPGLLLVRLSLAGSLSSAGHGDAALEVLDKALPAQKNTAGYMVERNWALWSMGRTKELEAALEKDMTGGARIPELYLQRALLRLKKADYAGARSDAEEMLRNNGQSAMAVRLVADTYVAQHENAKAMARLQEAAQAHPQSAPLETLLGQWYVAAGKLDEAQKAFEAAKSADFKYLEADYGLAQIEYRRKNLPGAAQRLSAIANVDRRNVAVLMFLARVQEESGDRDSAIKRYRQVLDFDANNAGALSALAYDTAFESPDEALKLAEHAVEVAPDNAEAQDALGWIYYRKGIYQNALNYLKTASTKAPTPRHQFHLAMAYLKTGDQKLGQQTMAAALAKDPELPKREQGW